MSNYVVCIARKGSVVMCKHSLPSYYMYDCDSQYVHPSNTGPTGIYACKRFNPIHLFYSHPILSVILHSEYWSTISHELLCELLVGCLSMSCLALIGQTSFDKIQPDSGISKQLPGVRSRSSSTIGAADELLFTA